METIGFRKTHPLVLGAAASVMVVSLVGAAAIGGLLPNARSDKTDTPAQSSAPAADSARHGVLRPAARDSACASCGTVESIRAMEIKGNATGVGAVAGGVTGAVVGNQLGRGNGNTAMTTLGAAGGALAFSRASRTALSCNARFACALAPAKVFVHDGWPASAGVRSKSGSTS